MNCIVNKTKEALQEHFSAVSFGLSNPRFYGGF